MPRLDGTGPASQGPMTGRGEGYCALPLVRPGETRQGYAGLQGRPVRLIGRFSRGLRPRLGRGLRRGRGAGRGRGGIGRGRRFGR
jgi:hypothetical protein